MIVFDLKKIKRTSIKNYHVVSLITKNIQVKLGSNINNQGLKILPNVRQNIYLKAKESINNIAKHSDTKKVNISLQIQKHQLGITIKDYG